MRRGYRLYDDKALEVLQQILFFREFDMPAGISNGIMEDPELDKKSVIKQSERYWVLKRKARAYHAARR